MWASAPVSTGAGAALRNGRRLRSFRVRQPGQLVDDEGLETLDMLPGRL